MLTIFKDIFACSVLLFDPRVVPVRLSVLPESWMKNNDMILKTTAFLYIPNYQITKTSTCTWNIWNYNIDFQFRNYNEGLTRSYLCTAYPGFAITWVHPRHLLEVRVAHYFSFLCCICLRPVSVYPMLIISLDCPFLIAPSVYFQRLFQHEAK